jgi:ankyrin repeat protein
VVRLLVDRGAAVDAQAPDGWTALLWASSSGHLEIVKYLVEHGAVADIVASEQQITPLFMASNNGHVRVVEYLLQLGAAVSPRAFNGGTPLHYGVQNGHAEVARLLLDHDANIHATTTKGVAVIALAQSSGMLEDIIKRLT